MLQLHTSLACHLVFVFLSNKALLRPSLPHIIRFLHDFAANGAKGGTSTKYRWYYQTYCTVLQLYENMEKLIDS